ncbi:ATP-binding protein [Streptomyces sp. NPDC050732]|uniref:ATP-binding protein n=1 Tax=Streptomyces sp. NPDC050732 TaxID=3154632 RepID=UPI0034223B61
MSQSVTPYPATTNERIDDYLPFAPESVLDDLDCLVEVGPRPSGSSVPRHTAEWVGRFRRIGAAKLRHHGLEALIDDMMVLASELLTNGLLYGNGVLGFRLLITADAIGIVVFDGSINTPQVRGASVTEENGRGMFIVDTLATDWGVSPDGMATWCTLAIPARQS